MFKVSLMCCGSAGCRGMLSTPSALSSQPSMEPISSSSSAAAVRASDDLQETKKNKTALHLCCCIFFLHFLNLEWWLWELGWAGPDPHLLLRSRSSWQMLAQRVLSNFSCDRRRKASSGVLIWLISSPVEFTLPNTTSWTGISSTRSYIHKHTLVFSSSESNY